MKKIFYFTMFLLGFIIFNPININAEYQGNLGYEYSLTGTRFYFLSENTNIKKIHINIEGIGTPQEMIKDDSGVYIIDIGGDLKNKTYYYSMCDELNQCDDVIDPFSLYLNKEGNKNLIVDVSSKSVDGWDDVITINVTGNQKIYAIEADKFVKDIDVSSLEINDSIYQKLTASVSNSNVQIGYDYLISLGVNYIEMGSLYSNSNYYFPNYSYSSSLDNYSPIIELKEMIQKYKASKMNISMRTDFLNPSEELKNILLKLSSDYIVDSKININNKTMQRYISDVYKYWVNEYKIDGFYIQNAELYGNEYLEQLITELKELNSNIFIYTDSNNSSVYTSDELQKLLIGSLEDSKNEGILNNNDYSKENFETILNSITSGYYKNTKEYKNSKNTVINNFGSFTGLDIYSKLVLVSGLGVKESVTSSKINLALQIIMLSEGVPRIIAGNEFLNVNTIPTSELDSVSDDNKICNQTKSMCYLIGENKIIDWNYLLKNGSALKNMITYRNQYSLYYFSKSFLNNAKSITLDDTYLSMGLMYITADFGGKNNGDLETTSILINFNANDANIEGIKNKEKKDFKNLLFTGNVLLKDDNSKISGYTILSFSYYKNTKLANWVYLLILVLLFTVIIGLRYVLIKLLQKNHGIDFYEIKKENKKTKKSKIYNYLTKIKQKYLNKKSPNKNTEESNQNISNDSNSNEEEQK